MVAILIVVWAVVLVPMWAHRYSPADSELSPQARVIRRRASSGLPTAGMTGHRKAVGTSAQRAARLRRRRYALLALTAITALTSLAAVIGLVSSTVPLVAGLGLAADVAWLRYTVVHPTALGIDLSPRARPRRAANDADFGAGTPTQDASQGVIRPGAADPADGLPAEAEAVEMVAESGEPWTPVPLPLPSYVTAPPAPRVVRGAWRDGDWHEEDLTEGELPGEASAYALDADRARRRAVGD